VARVEDVPVLVSIAQWRVDETEVLKRNADPTPEEIEAFIQSREIVWKDWRNDALAQLRSWLEHGCVSIH
jgi:hypothetical protein